jgi:hypothetical protein
MENIKKLKEVIMFDKLIQKVVLAQAKTQARKLVEQGVVTLENLDMGINADRIVKAVEALLIKKGLVLPSFIADAIEAQLARILDIVRDEAIKFILEKANALRSK